MSKTKKETKSYLYYLERKNILINILWISILLIVDLFFFIFLIFEGSFAITIPFMIYGIAIILFLVKNYINLLMLNFANNQLDNHDLNINIYFKWIRKQTGLKIFSGAFIIAWIVVLGLYQLLFNYEIILISSFKEYTIFALGSLVIFIFQLILNWHFNNRFQKSLEQTKSMMPWSKSFDLEILMTQKQAKKDYYQLIWIMLATVTIIPIIIYMGYKHKAKE